MKRPRCPTCDAPMARAVYGLVVDIEGELGRQLEAGEVVLAGCCVEVDAPEWACTRCSPLT